MLKKTAMNSSKFPNIKYIHFITFRIKFSLPITFNHPIYRGTIYRGTAEAVSLVPQLSSFYTYVLHSHQSISTLCIGGNGQCEFRRTRAGERDQQLRPLLTTTIFGPFRRWSRNLHLTTGLLFSRQGFFVHDFSKTHRTIKTFRCVTPSFPKIEKWFYETSLNGVANCQFHYHFGLFFLHHFIISRHLLVYASSSSTQKY